MLPASRQTVADFTDAQAELKSRATVERYRSSIAALHRAAGLPNPCADDLVRLAIKSMSRAQGRRQKQAEPLNRPGIDRMIEVKAWSRAKVVDTGAIAEREGCSMADRERAGREASPSAAVLDSRSV